MPIPKIYLQFILVIHYSFVLTAISLRMVLLLDEETRSPSLVPFILDIPRTGGLE